MTAKRGQIDFGNSEAEGLSLSLVFMSINKRNADNTAALVYTNDEIIGDSLMEFGKGIYSFQYDAEELDDDIVFVAEADGYRVAGEIRKERYPISKYIDPVFNSNGQPISYVETVEMRHPITGIYEETVRTNVTWTYSGTKWSEIKRQRIS